MKSIALGLFFGILIVAGSPVSKERFAPWRSVSFVAELPSPYGQSRVSIIRDGTETDSRIESITISLKGKDITVPKPLFADLPKPQLTTVYLSSEIGGRGKDGVYINFRYGDKALNGKGEYALAQIILWDSKISGRSIRKQTSLTTWNYDDKP